jgi:hypothetical protein
MGAIAAAPARVAPVQAAAAVAEALDALTAAPALRGLLKHVAADALGALAGLLATAGPPAGLVASLDAICSRALAPSVASSESPAIFRQVVLRALKVPGFVGRAQGTGGVEGGRRRGGRGGRGWEAKGCVVARSVRELPLLLRDGKWTEGGCIQAVACHYYGGILFSLPCDTVLNSFSSPCTTSPPHKHTHTHTHTHTPAHTPAHTTTHATTHARNPNADLAAHQSMRHSGTRGHHRYPWHRAPVRCRGRPSHSHPHACRLCRRP